MKPLYSSLAPFKTCDAHLKRELGIRVSAPFEPKGLNPTRTVVDIEIEAPITNTVSTVQLAVPAADWKTQAVHHTRKIVCKIDAVLAELEQHRNRLCAEIQRIQECPAKQIDLEVGSSEALTARPAKVGL